MPLVTSCALKETWEPAPSLLQAAVLVPGTAEGQCRSAVVFAKLLLGLLLPALLLVRAADPTAPRPQAPITTSSRIR